jgi:4,5-dihydroxyphthalate decarboxylase
MPRLPLSYSGMLYPDRTLALALGDVRPAGVDLNYVVTDSPGDLFRQQVQYAQYDVSEMSLATLILMVARGDDRFVGLPIYVMRSFRHGQVYVHEDSGIRQPSDLRGKRVGVVEYQMTTALWVRAFLRHDYGVDAPEMEWYTGGLVEPMWAGRLAVDLPAEVRLERIPADATLEGMLAAGELDALVTIQPPRGFSPAEGPVRRLFPDYRQAERAYYLKSGHFPIMHVVALRREVYERNRWLALSLLEAFRRAKEAGMRRMRAVTGLAVSLPWLGPDLDEIDELFGGDAFPYGYAANARTLEAMTRYAHEQGLAVRKVDPAELVAPETIQDPVPL